MACHLLLQIGERLARKFAEFVFVIAEAAQPRKRARRVDLSAASRCLSAVVIVELKALRAEVTVEQLARFFSPSSRLDLVIERLAVADPLQRANLVKCQSH